MDRKQLIKKLDKVVSEVVRRAYSKDGVTTCYTCGKQAPWQEMDCGHYVKRRFLNTRWEIDNLRPQCPMCNRVLGGNYEWYTQNLMREKGQNEPDRLWKQARENKKLSNIELEEMLNEWKSILKTIKKDQVE